MTRTRDTLRKDLSAYEHLAEVVGALSSPIRLELIESLAQCERPVEALAEVCALPVKTVSHHLQKLRAVGLVRRTARGREAFYSLANTRVLGLWSHLRALARAEAPGADDPEAGSEPPPPRIGTSALGKLVDEGHAVLLDVRPAVEYAAGHIPGTRSIPLDDLTDHLHELPRNSLIVAVCRGPYCGLADTSVEILNAHGFEAVSYGGGVLEWRATGGDMQCAGE